MKECHGVQDARKLETTLGHVQRVLVRDGDGEVELSLSTSNYPAGLTPEAARFLAVQLVNAANRVERLNGAFMIPATEETDADPGNPNVTTYPPEMLPVADGPAEVIVVNNDGSQRVVYRSDED